MAYSRLKYLELKDNHKKVLDRLTKREKQNAKKLISRCKQAERLRETQIKANNPTERRLRFAMQNEGINYEYQKPFYSVSRFVCVDFFLPDLNIVLELDGFSHNNTKDYDLNRTIYLKRKHNVAKVVRIKNSDVVFHLQKVINKIKLL